MPRPHSFSIQGDCEMSLLTLQHIEQYAAMLKTTNLETKKKRIGGGYVFEMQKDDRKNFLQFTIYASGIKWDQVGTKQSTKAKISIQSL